MFKYYQNYSQMNKKVFLYLAEPDKKSFCFGANGISKGKSAIWCRYFSQYLMEASI